MRIGLLGGTGDMGMGLALRWGNKHEIYVGSRSRERAESSACEYTRIAGSRGTVNARIVGMLNDEVVKLSEVVVFTVPYEPSIELATRLASLFKGKLVVSPIVPLKRDDGLFFHNPLKGTSAAEELKEIIHADAKVVSALHTVPAGRLIREGALPNNDVVVCGDEKEAKEVVMSLIREIEGLRPVDGGALRNSRLVEALVPLLLNISRTCKIKEPMIKFVWQ
jgi:NADPH-dependent F420 reductase